MNEKDMLEMIKVACESGNIIAIQAVWQRICATIINGKDAALEKRFLFGMSRNFFTKSLVQETVISRSISDILFIDSGKELLDAQPLVISVEDATKYNEKTLLENGYEYIFSMNPDTTTEEFVAGCVTKCSKLAFRGIFRLDQHPKILQDSLKLEAERGIIRPMPGHCAWVHKSVLEIFQKSNILHIGSDVSNAGLRENYLSMRYSLALKYRDEKKDYVMSDVPGMSEIFDTLGDGVLDRAVSMKSAGGLMPKCVYIMKYESHRRESSYGETPSLLLRELDRISKDPLKMCSQVFGFWHKDTNILLPYLIETITI